MTHDPIDAISKAAAARIEQIKEEGRREREEMTREHEAKRTAMFAAAEERERKFREARRAELDRQIEQAEYPELKVLLERLKRRWE